MDWSAGQFGVGVVLAVVALSALYCNYLLVANQYHPHVILYSINDQSRPTVIMLVIENIGRGVAKDVSFRSSRPIPCKVYGVTQEQATAPEGFDMGPLSSGIPALGPGAKRAITWGQYGGLRRLLGEDRITVTASYRSDGFGTFGPGDHVTVSVLEIASFDHTDAVDPDGARQAVRELRRIRAILGSRLNPPGAA